MDEYIIIIGKLTMKKLFKRRILTLDNSILSQILTSKILKIIKA